MIIFRQIFLRLKEYFIKKLNIIDDFLEDGLYFYEKNLNALSIIDSKNCNSYHLSIPLRIDSLGPETDNDYMKLNFLFN